MLMVLPLHGGILGHFPRFPLYFSVWSEPVFTVSTLELYNQKKIKLVFNFKKEIKTGCWKFLFKITSLMWPLLTSH